MAAGIAGSTARIAGVPSTALSWVGQRPVGRGERDRADRAVRSPSDSPAAVIGHDDADADRGRRVIRHDHRAGRADRSVGARSTSPRAGTRPARGPAAPGCRPRRRCPRSAPSRARPRRSRRSRPPRSRTPSASPPSHAVSASRSRSGVRPEGQRDRDAAASRGIRPVLERDRDREPVPGADDSAADRRERERRRSGRDRRARGWEWGWPRRPPTGPSSGSRAIGERRREPRRRACGGCADGRAHAGGSRSCCWFAPVRCPDRTIE